MMSIEVLYTSETIRSSGISDGQGGKPLVSKDTKLIILADIQKNEPIGNLILQSKIQLNEPSKLRLKKYSTAWLQQKSDNKVMATIIAEIAVNEHCGTNICDKCKGRGEYLYPKISKIVTCKKCEGRKYYNLTENELYRLSNSKRAANDKMTGTQYKELYYPMHLQTIKYLQKHEWQAEDLAKRLIKELTNEQSITD